MHVFDNKTFLDSGQEVLPIHQKIRNDAADPAAIGENRAGDGTHETGGAAAIDETDPGLCHGMAKLSRGRFINGIGTLGGAAINANIANEWKACLHDDLLR